MPTYEYHCEECGYIFEAVQRITDDPLTEAEDCAASVKKCSLKRLLFSPAVRFKGEGWTPSYHGTTSSEDES